MAPAPPKGPKMGSFAGMARKSAKQKTYIDNGAFCSSSAAASFGVYLFNNGSSGFLTCGATSFSINATTALAAPVNSSATTTSSSPQPTQAGGDNSTNSSPSNKWVTVAVPVGVVAGIVTILAGTFGILKWLRGHPKPPPTIYTSTEQS